MIKDGSPFVVTRLDHEDTGCECERCGVLRHNLAGMYFTVSSFAEFLSGDLLGGEREAIRHARHHFAAWLAELDHRKAA